MGHSVQTDVRGSCFGYTVRSTLPLARLRSPLDGAPYLDLGVLGVDVDDEATSAEAAGPIATWSPPDAPFQARLYGNQEHLRLHLDDPAGGCFEILAPQGRIGVPPGREPVGREDLLWELPVVLWLVASGDLVLRASAVDIGGEALLIADRRKRRPNKGAASSGAAVAAGFPPLSAGFTHLGLAGTAVVHPGPAPRTPPAVAGHAGAPGGAAQGVAGDGAPVRLAGIVCLETAISSATFRVISPVDAVSELWELAVKGVPTFDGLVDQAVPRRPRTAGKLPGGPHPLDEIIDLVGGVHLWSVGVPDAPGAVTAALRLLTAAEPVPA